MQYAVYALSVYIVSGIGVFLGKHLLLLTYRHLAPYQTKPFLAYRRRNRKKIWQEYFTPVFNTVVVILYVAVCFIIVWRSRNTVDPVVIDEHDPYNHWQ